MANLFYEVVEVSSAKRKTESGGTRDVQRVTLEIPRNSIATKKKKKERTWTLSELREAARTLKQAASYIEPKKKKKAKDENPNNKPKPKK